MFTQTLISAALLALASSAVATPIGAKVSRTFTPNVGPSTSLSHLSFNGWGGFDCLNGFDDFYGDNNFNGCFNQQVVVQQQEQITCQRTDIHVIQQQFAIITEYAKQILLTQICQVEVQTIVWSQFISGLNGFTDDFHRRSHRNIGFDANIASHISDLTDGHGHANIHDFGFQGHEVGSHLSHVLGDNWQDGSSEVSVDSAFRASQIAVLQQSSSSSSFGGSFNGGSNFGFGNSPIVSVGSF